MIRPIGYPNVTSLFIDGHSAGRIVTAGSWRIGGCAGGKICLPPDIVGICTVGFVGSIVEHNNSMAAFLNDVNATRAVTGDKTQAGKSIAGNVCGIRRKIRLTQYAVSGSAIGFIRSIIKAGDTAVAGFADPKSAVFIYKQSVGTGHTGCSKRAATCIKIGLPKHAVGGSAVGFCGSIVIAGYTVRVEFCNPKRTAYIHVTYHGTAHGTLGSYRSFAGEIGLTQYSVGIHAGSFVGGIIKTQYAIVGKITYPEPALVIDLHTNGIIHLSGT